MKNYLIPVGGVVALAVVASIIMSSKTENESPPKAAARQETLRNPDFATDRDAEPEERNSRDEAANSASELRDSNVSPRSQVSLAGSQVGVRASGDEVAPDSAAGSSGVSGGIGGPAEAAVASGARNAGGAVSGGVGVIPGGFAGSVPSVGNPNQSLREPPPLAETRRREEIEIEVPFGAKVPIVFLDDTPRPAPQERVLEQIMEEFTQAVETNPANWDAARERADHRYKILYGDAAYNQLTMGAALQALEERKEAAR